MTSAGESACGTLLSMGGAKYCICGCQRERLRIRGLKAHLPLVDHARLRDLAMIDCWIRDRLVKPRLLRGCHRHSTQQLPNKPNKCNRSFYGNTSYGTPTELYRLDRLSRVCTVNSIVLAAGPVLRYEYTIRLTPECWLVSLRIEEQPRLELTSAHCGASLSALLVVVLSSAPFDLRRASCRRPPRRPEASGVQRAGTH